MRVINLPYGQVAYSSQKNSDEKGK